MANWHISPSRLQGTIALPPSKSQTLRALLFASLAEGQSRIDNCLVSPDTDAMVSACTLLGADITRCGSGFLVKGTAGRIGPPENVIDAGNSGIVLRFITAIAALSPFPVVITGDYSLRHQRPMQPLLDALQRMGVEALSTKRDGFAPVIIKGPLRFRSTVVKGEDSQFVSALLIALAFSGAQGELVVTDPGEKPWVALTLDWFRRLNIPCENEDFRHYRVSGSATIKGFQYTVPGDLSSMAFPLVAALATGSSLTITNVDMDEPQGDKKIVDILRQMGAGIACKGGTLRVEGGAPLRGIEVDVNDCIDALPILAVVGCFASGTTRLRNAAVARQKESDRLSVMTAELGRLGADIEEDPEGLTIRQSSLQAAEVRSQGDHRIAMALAVAALGASGTTLIKDIDCAAKTYPGFADEMAALGASIGVKK